MQISDAVLAELSLANVTDDGRQVALARQVDRKLYERTNEVLEALGGTWRRKAQAHVFSSDVRPQLEAALSSGAVTTDYDLGFFPTPAELARQLVALGGVRQGDLCLEPSAGEGRIVSEILDVGASVVAIERHAGRRQSLLDAYGHKRFFFVAPDDDCLTYQAEEPFDRVIMNPPFVRAGAGDHIDHVLYAYALLITGGVLVSVLPAGVQFRQDRRHKNFRAWCLQRGTITDLPEGAFKASGTGVRTCVVRLMA